jgi:hypothetical protein
MILRITLFPRYICVYIDLYNFVIIDLLLAFMYLCMSYISAYDLIHIPKQVRTALQGVSEWFDEYMAKEELTPGQEPEMYKAMVRIDTYIHTLHTTFFLSPLSRYL